MQAEFTVILHCMYSQNKMVVAYPYVETSLHSLSLCVLALLYDRFLFFFFSYFTSYASFLIFFFCLRKFFFTFLDPFSSLLFFIFNSLLLVLFFQCKPFFFLKNKNKNKNTPKQQQQNL